MFGNEKRHFGIEAENCKPMLMLQEDWHLGKDQKETGNKKGEEANNNQQGE